MSDTWSTILALAAITALIKAAGPIVVGGRALPPPALRMIALVAPALLAALVVVQTFTRSDGSLELDARALGLGAAAVVLVRDRNAMLLAVVAAAVAAALARVLV